MKFFKSVKAKALAAVATLGFAPAVFAEDSNAIDTTAATTALTQMTTAVKGYITSAAPILAGLLGGCLLLALIWVAFKWAKKGTNKA